MGEIYVFAKRRDIFVFMLKKIKVFFSQVKEELSKVDWTKRPELIASTSVVIITVVVLCIYIGLVDIILTKVIDFVLR